MADPPNVQPVLISSLALPQAPDRFAPDDDDIQELAASISLHGLLQPVVAAPLDNGPGYLLIAGQRRVIACASLGWTEIPATILHLRGVSPEALRLTENVQRLDLSPIEEAVAINRWRKLEKLTQEQAAERLGRGISWLKKREGLLHLQDDLINALHANQISPSVALELSRIDDDAHRDYCLEQAQQYGATQDVAAAWASNWKAQGPTANPIPTDQAATSYARNPGGHKLACHACNKAFPLATLRNVFLCPADLDALSGATAKLNED